ncbi:transmembrane protein, putative (macronuclear) [Tetrahymena thermophila SB210]|uniref:Transmembrane protein, putative n=1 Tax=Tetrahymena thermophila (strain SB210) TaxID=312017 RepID=Q233D6_TETTS|nr:transmembrane protein, putative [Tetrahymena thermophila SB210]EAR91644.2 transmembrane protein, putative [Tetrahymena thermophila SB210]|eukprot:XP_001011889.2 transmembrane protein, putative [Tetrahymena thermophila SB210]
MMFIFAGSQYIFHFILSIGSNFVLNSAVIFIQNISYSAVFYPGQLNSFHGLLFFSVCFLTWMKYKNEKYQRDLFLLQENEKEVNQFVRDVLPASVFIVKYDSTKDLIEKKLINRTAQQEYNIKDDSLLIQFLRSTIIQKDSQQKQQTSLQLTRASFKAFSPTKNTFMASQIQVSDTLERFIYYKFRDMIQQNKSKQDDKIQQITKQVDVSQLNDESKQFEKKIYQNSIKEQSTNSINSNQKLGYFNNFTKQMSKQQSPLQSFENCSREIFNFQSKFNKKNISLSKSPLQKQDINSKQIQENEQQQEQLEEEKYKVEEFNATIIKNNVKINVLVKIVFYYLSYPVCSICIDEDLKKQMVFNNKQSKIKENIYLQHFTKMSQKFQKILKTENFQLNQSYSLLYLNQLRNIQDFVQLKLYNKIKINYNLFQLSALVKYIQNVFQPIYSALNIEFSVNISCQQNLENQLLQVFLSKKEDIIRSQNDTIQENLVFFPKNVLLSEIEQSKLNNSEFYDKCELYQNFDNNQENIEVINDQQRVCQMIINLLENSLDYLIKKNLTQKYVKLLIKIIKGKDENSNLIEFKVINNAELNYSKQEIFLVQESLKVEREIKNNYFMQNSQSCLQPTQIGLKLNQKILEKTSPYNFMNIDCDDDKIGFSFYIFQNCNILQQDYKQDFQNKLFEEIRGKSQTQNESQPIKIENQSIKIEEILKQIYQQQIGKDILKISKNMYCEKEENQKKNLMQSNEEQIYNQTIEIDPIFVKNEFEIDQLDERVDQNDFQIKEFNSKNVESLNKQNKENQ